LVFLSPDGSRGLFASLIEAQDEDGRRLTDDQIRDEVVTKFLAGHETTASLIAVTLHFLASHPAALAKVQREADKLLGEQELSMDSLRRSPYLVFLSPDGRRGLLASLIEDQDEDGRRLTDDQIRDEVVTKFLAGHETTASLIAVTRVSRTVIKDTKIGHYDIEAGSEVNIPQWAVHRRIFTHASRRRPEPRGRVQKAWQRLARKRLGAASA